jgi:RNA polymerase sigma factor (sigma-70 family)
MVTPPANRAEPAISLAHSTLRPLTRNYTREAAVVQELGALGRLSGPELWRRLKVADREAPDYTRLESAVYCLRDALCRRDEDEAWRIAEILMERIKRTVTRRLAVWRSLSPDQRAEVEEELAVSLYTEWMSLDGRHEFWEVRFGVCLARAISDHIDRVQRVRQNEMTLSATEDGEGGASDPWERFADESPMDAETSAIVMAALGALPVEQRTAFYLYHYADWTEERIARHMGVTSRSVRNYLSRAKHRLAEWRGAENN